MSLEREGDGAARAIPADAPALPEGVLCVRLGPGANCSSVGSAIDVLFYGSVIAGAIAVALAAAFPPKIEDEPGEPDAEPPRDDDDASRQPPSR